MLYSSDPAPAPFAAGAMGYLFGDLNVAQRTVLIVSACLLVFPVAAVDVVALGLFLAIAIPQYLKWRNTGQDAAARSAIR